MSNLCLQVFKNLKDKYPDQRPFLSFLKTVSLTEGFSKGKRAFTLNVPSSFHKERAKNKLLPLLEKELFSLLNEPLKIEIEVFPTTKKTPPLLSPQISQKKEKYKKNESFNSTYTFKNFISGPSNSLALGSLKHVSQHPLSSPYSPLFIYGKTGLGKTHLLHALGQEILLKHPSLSLHYLSAERFLHRCVTSIRLNQMESFQKQFRNTYQVLLIDDIQAIERGLASQEEFFHTFNAITERKGLVVCSCDCLPTEIRKMETRLQTRLSGGLVIKIDPPDLETRIAILQNKSQQKRISLSQDVLMYIAKKNQDASVRELEGYLNKIKMVCDLQNQEPSLDFIKEMLSKEVINTSSSVEGLIYSVASKHYLSPSKLVSLSRDKNIVYARNQAILLVHEKNPHLSLTQIGRIFGGRNHSTILHSLKQAKKQNRS